MTVGGPLGWLIAGGLGVFSILESALSEDKPEWKKRAEAMNRKLDSDQRQQVFSTIKENWEDTMEAIKNSIRQSLMSDESIMDSINTVSKEYMQAYKDCLKFARILID